MPVRGTTAGTRSTGTPTVRTPASRCTDRTTSRPTVTTVQQARHLGPARPPGTVVTMTPRAVSNRPVRVVALTRWPVAACVPQLPLARATVTSRNLAPEGKRGRSATAAMLSLARSMLSCRTTPLPRPTWIRALPVAPPSLSPTSLVVRRARFRETAFQVLVLTRA